MADDQRVTGARAYVKLGPAEDARITATRAYVKRRLYSDEMRATGVAAYVKFLVPWPDYTTYRVKDGHNQALTADEDVTPQPRTTGIKVTRRAHSVSGGLQDEFLYVELLFSSLGSVSEFQSVLTQFGLLAADENDVTVLVRDHAFRWKRYNGTAVRPLQGVDVKHERYFARDVVILVKFLELVG